MFKINRKIGFMLGLAIVLGLGVSSVFAQQVKLDLIPPTEISGYAKGLQAGGGDLTTLVVMITNYVLGFLGLLSITAIIYAGILYVANFGNEEMATKAKTIITYVAVGIVVIILSYAIVNALVGVVGSDSGNVPSEDGNVVSIDALFDVTGKDFVYPIVMTLSNLGDICPSTTIGLIPNNTGCAQNELVPDTDSDGIANLLDTDKDNDGEADEADTDDDGDDVLDTQDACPDTLSYLSFKVSNLERNKIQVDRASAVEYQDYISEHDGCAEYQRKSDIDGDSVLDVDDCDRDADGLVDNSECGSDFVSRFPPGNPENLNVTPETVYRGIVVFDVIRDDIDNDDDNDGVADFGSGVQSDEREILLRQLANNFSELERFIRITCAILPQTRKVFDYCGIDQQTPPQPVGKLVRRLNQLSSDLTFVDFEKFNELYQEFLAVAKSIPRVKANINTSNDEFEGFLPGSGPLTFSFDATRSVDPYQEFCAQSPSNYHWFVNRNLDFSKGIGGLIAPDQTGFYFNYGFTAPGVYNVQLLVKSSCKYNAVNPGAGENENVDAAIAGLASARINVFPPNARLVIKMNDQYVESNTFNVLSGTTAPISIDLRESQTTRGTFEELTFDCGNGDRGNIQGDQSNWLLECAYTAEETSTNRKITLRANDGEGEVGRDINLTFNDIISILNVEPGLEGSTGMKFTFSGDRSSVASGARIDNLTYLIQNKQGDVTVAQIDKQRASDLAEHTFAEPGEYRIKLTVSVAGGKSSFDEKIITIAEQEPVAAFTITFPQNIRPARALFDGSSSFHPDYPNSTLGYSWEVDGVMLDKAGPNARGPFVYEQQTVDSDAKIFYEFQSVGEHQVSLTVSKGAKSDKSVDQVEVKTLLGVDFTIDTQATRVNELVTFTPANEGGNALGFYWDFGDGSTVVAQNEDVVHKYSKQGGYVVKLTVEDGAGNTNSTQKKVIVGLQNTPIPFVQVFASNIEQDLSLVDCVEITRNDNVVFDAGKSLSVAGETTGISFRWDIEEYEEIIQTRTFSRIFKDLTPGGCIDVNLTITDLTTNATAQADTVSIKVINSKPEITDVRFNVSGQEPVTPVTVNVSVVGARDLDGRVARFHWWYYEEGQGRKKLDQRISDIGRTTFVIGPNNIEGTKTTYYIGVEVEDNDGGITSNIDNVGESKPLVVTNGPNIAPVAEFVTDRSTIQTGELISFTSTTRDPLGEFIPSAAYQWDFDGDGQYERGISGSKVSHRYDQPGLYRSILKVTKNGLSSQYEMIIRVIASTKEPEAAFIYVLNGAEVKFISNSQVDPALEDKKLSHAWDLDTTVDGDGNGIVDDDTDSALVSPTFVYEGNRDMFVSLKVTDSVGVSDRVTRMIPFIRKDRDRGALGTSNVIRLKPVLISNPPQNSVDGRVYIRPPYSDVIFNAKQSQGKIQEYRLDSNIFIDSDGDGIKDNDIDNKTHKSWKDGSSFKWTYRSSSTVVDSEPALSQIRAKLTIVSLDGNQKSQVVDVIFSEKDPDFDVDQTQSPEEILNLFENVPMLSFDMSSPFSQPGDEVTFDASRTRFPNEKVKEYRWDFDGDGLVDEISFDPTFKYTYPKAGVYEVIMEAVSEGGLQGEYTQTIFIRGGLELPQADFEYSLVDNQLTLTNTSTYDSSYKEEEIEFQWIFKKLDLNAVVAWKTWEQTDEYMVDSLEFDQGPLFVKEKLVFESSDIAPGVLPREVVLGSEELVAGFKEGTTFVTTGAQPYAGELKLFEVLDNQVQIPDKNILAAYDSGVLDILETSEDVRFIYNGVIASPELYQLREGLEPLLIAQGTVEKNLTVFTGKTFGGKYLLAGIFEQGDEMAGEVLGVSSVKDPVKVFSDAGLYQVTLEMSDPVKEKSEKTELITIDESLQIVEPGALPVTPEPEDVVIVPGPQIVPDDAPGFSYWWLFFIILLLVIIGAVGFVVLQTIRKRQEELESQPVNIVPEAIEPVVVVKPPVAPSQPPVPAAPKPVPEKPVEKKEEKKDDQEPKGGSGPIPDWLKG